MQSKATTVEKYLAELPEDRRSAIQAVRRVILKNLDKDYEEGMQYGMIGYYVPHRIYPPGYHCDPTQPLCFAALASQKHYMSLYMMPIYGSKNEEGWFRKEWAKTGKKLNMGKSCIRFTKVDDLALEVIAEAIRRAPVGKYLEFYESEIRDSRKSTTKRASSASRPAKSVKAARTKKTVRKAATESRATRG